VTGSDLLITLSLTQTETPSNRIRTSGRWEAPTLARVEVKAGWYYGWLRVADQQARQAFNCGLLDLPPRDWREMYIGRVAPIEAADAAIDEHAAQHGTGPAPIPRPVAPAG